MYTEVGNLYETDAAFASIQLRRFNISSTLYYSSTVYLSAFYSQIYLLCATDGSVIPGPRLPVRESVKNQIPIPELHTQFLIIFHISKSTQRS